METERNKKILMMQVGAVSLTVLILIIWLVNLKNVWRADQAAAPTGQPTEWSGLKNDLDQTLKTVQDQLAKINQARQVQSATASSAFLTNLLDAAQKSASATSVPLTTASGTLPTAPIIPATATRVSSTAATSH